MRVELSCLPNGVRVATCELPDARSVHMGIWTGVGGRSEPAKISGISHFIEHLLFKGTAKRTPRQISQTVEGVGGYLNAFTAEECTCYLAACAAEYIPRVFDVLSDMYLHPRFANQDIERERQVICEEILMYRDDPGQHVQELLSEIVWPGHALGRSITGSIPTVQKLERADFLKFRERHYHGGSTIITFAGKITHAQSFALAKEFESLPKRKGERHRSPDASDNKPRFVTLRREIEQTHLALAFPGLSFHDQRRHTLSLLNVILGGNMSSRLFQELREKRGLCYHVSSQGSQFSDCGIFNISCGLEPKKLSRSLSLIFRECERLVKSPPTTSELRRAKDYVVGMSKMSEESLSSQNSRLGSSILNFNKIIPPEESYEKIRAVTAEQIQHVAKDIFNPRRLRAAVVGPVAEGEIDRIITDLL